MSTIEQGLHLNKSASIGRIAMATAVGLFGATVAADAVRGYIYGSDGANPAAAREITQEGIMPSQRPLSEYLAATLPSTPRPTIEATVTPTSTATVTATPAATVAEAKPATATAAPKIEEPQVINPGEMNLYFNPVSSVDQLVALSEQQKKPFFPLEFSNPESVKFERVIFGLGNAYIISFKGSATFFASVDGPVINWSDYIPGKQTLPVNVLETEADHAKRSPNSAFSFSSVNPKVENNPKAINKEITLVVPQNASYQVHTRVGQTIQDGAPFVTVQGGQVLLNMADNNEKDWNNRAALDDYATFNGKPALLASSK